MAVEVFQTSKREFKQVPIELINSAEEPSREVFEGIKRLADTIKTHGVLEPLIVKKLPNQVGFQVVCGERRLRGCRAAGLQRVPCIILDGVSEEQLFQMQLVENLQRSDLTPFEEIRLVTLLRERFSLTHEEIGQKVGVSGSRIGDYLLIAQALPEEIIRTITRTRGGQDRLKELSLSKAVILAKANLPPDRLREIVQRIQRVGVTTQGLTELLAGTRKQKIQRVVAGRLFWRELTKDLKKFARYWSDYATLKEEETVSEYHLTLEVVMPKDLNDKPEPDGSERLRADEAPQVCSSCGQDILEGDRFTEEEGFYYCPRCRSTL